VLAGCATPTAQAPAALPSPPDREIIRVPVKRMPAISGPATIQVRGVRDAEVGAIERIRGETREMTGSAIGLGAVSTAEAFLMPGFFSGSLVAGALILVPLAVGLDSVQRRQHERIAGALEGADFQGELRAQLGRSMVPHGAAGESAHRLSAIVIAYGLIPKYADQRYGPFCLVADVDLVLHAGERETWRDTVYLEPYRRSADAPPPVCATLERFAARDGGALRDAIAQYAQVVAAIARSRLPALSWESPDAPPHYAGKLRRLLLLPPLYDPVDPQCSRTPPEEGSRLIGEAARAFLVDWKGYEILHPGEDRGPSPLVRALGQWQARDFEQRRPPEALRTQLLAQAAATGADGVLVLHAVPECISTMDIALNLLGVGMPNFYRKALGNNFSAGLYRAEDGALIWQRRTGLGPATDSPLTRADAARSVETMLGVLDNALPEVLSRP
jgi:hypothetical protein